MDFHQREKSTSKQLKFRIYLCDTGAMYRAVTFLQWNNNTMQMLDKYPTLIVPCLQLDCILLNSNTELGFAEVFWTMSMLDKTENWTIEECVCEQSCWGFKPEKLVNKQEMGANKAVMDASRHWYLWYSDAGALKYSDGKC
jgi:hypothetical protein